MFIYIIIPLFLEWVWNVPSHVPSSSFIFLRRGITYFPIISHFSGADYLRRRNAKCYRLSSFSRSILTLTELLFCFTILLLRSPANGGVSYRNLNRRSSKFTFDFVFFFFSLIFFPWVSSYEDLFSSFLRLIEF